MKRILFASFLLTAAYSISFVQPAAAQEANSVSAADLTTKANQFDAQIVAGDVAAEKATWAQINNLLKAELRITKGKIMSAATPGDQATYIKLNQDQYKLYNTIWKLSKDLVTNRVALHDQLKLFAATIN